jgi:hypothetical protein
MSTKISIERNFSFEAGRGGVESPIGMPSGREGNGGGMFLSV